MNLRFVTLTIVLVSSLMLPKAFAQAVQPTDFIVAVVNAEPITNNEVRLEVTRVTQGLEQLKQVAPTAPVLRSQVLERLINDRAQLQVAKETGIRVDPATIDLAEENAARQNMLTVTEFRKRLLKEGVDKDRFRAQLRDQLMLTRLHERDVESRIRISEVELDRYISEQQSANADPFARDINLAQILIATPEKATPSQISPLLAQAQALLERLRKGANFDALVQEFSAAQRDKGGQLGLRRADRYPRSFVLATQDLAVGSWVSYFESNRKAPTYKTHQNRVANSVTAYFVAPQPAAHARGGLGTFGGLQKASSKRFRHVCRFSETVLAGQQCCRWGRFGLGHAGHVCARV